MKRNLHTVAITWDSSSFSGAEKRMMSIASELNRIGQRAIVILEDRNAKALKDILGYLPPFVRILHTTPLQKAAGRGRGALRPYWWRSGLRHYYHSALRRQLKNIAQNENVRFWHVCLSSDLAHCTTGPTIFEVTSPDWADRLARNPTMIPDEVSLRAVSHSVATRLRSKLPTHQVTEAKFLFPNTRKIRSDAGKSIEKEKLIVFAHRLIPRKNGVLFAKVARRFLREQPDWKVAIRGQGPDEDQIKELLNKEISDGKVSIGYSRTLQDELSRSSIFVSLIQPDNYPSQSIVEAMTQSNALLLSNTGQSREKFLDRNGLTSEINEDKLLVALKTLTSKSTILSEMGVRSREIAEKNFSQENYIFDLLETYSSFGFKSIVQKGQ